MRKKYRYDAKVFVEDGKPFIFEVEGYNAKHAETITRKGFKISYPKYKITRVAIGNRRDPGPPLYKGPHIRL